MEQATETTAVHVYNTLAMTDLTIGDWLTYGGWTYLVKRPLVKENLETLDKGFNVKHRRFLLPVPPDIAWADKVGTGVVAVTCFEKRVNALVVRTKAFDDGTLNPIPLLAKLTCKNNQAPGMFLQRCLKQEYEIQRLRDANPEYKDGFFKKEIDESAKGFDLTKLFK